MINDADIIQHSGLPIVIVAVKWHGKIWLSAVLTKPWTFLHMRIARYLPCASTEASASCSDSGFQRCRERGRITLDPMPQQH